MFSKIGPHLQNIIGPLDVLLVISDDVDGDGRIPANFRVLFQQGPAKYVGQLTVVGDT